MDPTQPDFDPWTDTEAHRPPAREDPFDDGTVEGPFGTLSEVAGVPRLTAGTRHPGAAAGSRTLTTGITLLLLLLTAAAAVGGVVAWLS